MSKTTDHDLLELLDADVRRCRAMTEGDLAALAALLSDDLVYTHASGRVETKAQYLDAMRSGKVRYRAVHREGIVASVRGEMGITQGVLTLEVEREGRPGTVVCRVLCVWTRERRGWTMLAYAGTPVPKA